MQEFFLALVTPWLTVIYNPLMLLFTGLSLLQFYRGIGLVRAPMANWAAFSANPLTPPKKSLAENISFYVFVPLSILLHELAHAVVVWAFGGRVVEFGFFLFWGYVLPDRRFGPEQEWLLSIAGTWGNLLLGAAAWLVWRHGTATLRYLGKRVLRFQVYFALIYYPAFTAVLSFGDWRTIYDFSATPRLSAVTAVWHVALLGTFWWLDRQGWFELPAFASRGVQEQYAQVESRAALNPGDYAAQAQVVRLLARHGAAQQALQRTRRLARRFPQEADVHCLLASLQMGRSSYVPHRVARSAETALRLGLEDDGRRATMHVFLGMHADSRGRLAEALDQFELALGAGTLPPALAADVFHRRALIFRRQGQTAAALESVTLALQMATGIDDEAAATYAATLDVINRDLAR